VDAYVTAARVKEALEKTDTLSRVSAPEKA
jgi:hypothetical protein